MDVEDDDRFFINERHRKATYNLDRAKADLDKADRTYCIAMADYIASMNANARRNNVVTETIALIGAGWTAKEIGRRVCKSSKWVENIMQERDEIVEAAAIKGAAKTMRDTSGFENPEVSIRVTEAIQKPHPSGEKWTGERVARFIEAEFGFEHVSFQKGCKVLRLAKRSIFHDDAEKLEKAAVVGT